MDNLLSFINQNEMLNVTRRNMLTLMPLSATAPLKVDRNLITAPYVHSSTASIKWPIFNAPITEADDPAAATANSHAINALLSSGYKHVELDDQARPVNSTLLIHNSIEIHGVGRQQVSLVWIGQDFPIIARSNYRDLAGEGYPDVSIINLRITDLAESRQNFFGLDLSNAPSCRISGVHYDGSIGSQLNDKFGIILGTQIGSGFAKPTFVARIENSRFVNSKAVINTTDYDILFSEFWGTNRDNAVELGGGGRLIGGQIVPGQTAGVRVFSEHGAPVETLNIAHVMFDGSTDLTIITGWGLLADAKTPLIGPLITCNHFWHLSMGGLLIDKIVGGIISDNIFQDCDSDDSGETANRAEHDIVIHDASGTKVNNSHIRGLSYKSSDNIAPKTGRPRGKRSAPIFLNAKDDGALNLAGGQVQGFYKNSIYPLEGRVMNDNGSSEQIAVRRTNLPSARDFSNLIVTITNNHGHRDQYLSDGFIWHKL